MIPMNEDVNNYLHAYPDEIVAMYMELRRMIFENTSCEIEEKLWAKLPSYYAGESFIRLIPFKDHINVEASAAIRYREQLSGYKFTPKGMLQLPLKKSIPDIVLKQIFAETLKK